jgi:hypothetical protein
MARLRGPSTAKTKEVQCYVECRLVAPLIASLVFAVPVAAADHIVGAPDVSARLGEAAAARQANLADLSAFLGSPAGQRAAQVLGADTAKLRSRLSHLSDAEANDLALRARQLITLSFAAM